MENKTPVSVSVSKSTEWFSDEFIYASLAKYLKQQGYKVHKDPHPKDDKADMKIVASKFFKKEVIEVKGFPHEFYMQHPHVTPKHPHAKSWFSEALLNSFTNFSTFENAEIAMAVPNVGRYQAIIKSLKDYFTSNDLYFRIYLVNEDGSVDVSNLNETYHGK